MEFPWNFHGFYVGKPKIYERCLRTRSFSVRVPLFCTKASRCKLQVRFEVRSRCDNQFAGAKQVQMQVRCWTFYRISVDFPWKFRGISCGHSVGQKRVRFTLTRAGQFSFISGSHSCTSSSVSSYQLPATSALFFFTFPFMLSIS